MSVGKGELAELQRGLDEALVGQGRLFLVSGEPGIGKTRLCDELSAHAHARAVPVLWGRCWEAGGAPPYFPWLEPLSALCARLDAETLAASLGEGASALLELLPSLRPRLPSPPRVVADTTESERFRLFFAVTALLRRACASAGAMIVLDDLHAADEPSLLLLCFLARELRGTRVLLVATFRDVEARSSQPVSQALARLSREGTQLWLARLGVESSARILRERGGIEDLDVQGEVFRRTQGNPLFLEHMAQLLGAQAGADAARAALPSGVRELIGQRLSRVSQEVYALLEASAVVGDEFGVDGVADALCLDRTRVQAAFAEALVAGLLLERERGRFRFSHALVREVLERDLAPERARILHGAIARALSLHVQPGAEPPHVELAHHGLLGPSEGYVQAVQHALIAARRSLALLAIEEAVALLERAKVAVEAQPEHDPERSALLCDVLIALGEARVRRGDREQGQAFCLRAIELAATRSDPERMARGALAFGREITAALVQSQLVVLLQRALAALPVTDSPLRVQVSARLAAAMQPHHDLQIPIDLANEAIASARRIGDPATLLDALFSGMAAMMDIVDPRLRIPLNLEIEQLASAAGDREKVLRSHARLTFDHMELGDLASADGRIAAYERVARQAGSPRHLWRVPLFRSMRAQVHGHFAQAQALFEQACSLAREAGDPQLERCSIFHREGLLRVAERHDEMVAFDPEARRMRAALYSGPHWQNGGSAFTHARLEDLDNARLYLGLVPQDDWPLVQNPPAFMHLGEPLALVGARVDVERVYDQLLPANHRCISWGWTKFMWDGPASRVLGLLAARLERWEDAEAHFAHALAELERMQALPYLARTRYEHGRALQLRGRKPDLERAREQVERAGEAAAQLEMSGLLRLVNRRLESLPVAARAAPRSQPASGAVIEEAVISAAEPPLPFSFVSEGEYWSVSYAGETFRLRDSLGLQYLARLFAEPGRELHVLDLSAGPGADDTVAADRGDAGELLDETAKQRYRARLATLRETIEAAETAGNAERATAAQQELEALTAELSRAVGLGGRIRRAGVASERARSAVQRRIRNAIERVREASPALAALLERSVRTGTVCVFRPGA